MDPDPAKLPEFERNNAPGSDGKEKEDKQDGLRNQRRSFDQPDDAATEDPPRFNHAWRLEEGKGIVSNNTHVTPGCRTLALLGKRSGESTMPSEKLSNV